MDSHKEKAFAEVFGECQNLTVNACLDDIPCLGVFRSDVSPVSQLLERRRHQRGKTEEVVGRDEGFFVFFAWFCMGTRRH